MDHQVLSPDEHGNGKWKKTMPRKDPGYRHTEPLMSGTDATSEGLCRFS